jgi:ATP-dependent DNA helicase RecG
VVALLFFNKFALDDWTVRRNKTMAMTFEKLQRLIADGENANIELKKTTGELKEGMHAACAFLNGAGGWLIFGVTPKSLNILGQEATDNTQREIAQALSGLEPAVSVDVQYIDVPDRPGNKVIVMYFEAFVWGSAPYTYHGSPYYKVESTTKLMPRNMFEERLRANKPNYFAWERQPADHIAIEDMDEKLIRGALRLGVEKNRMPVTALTEPMTDVLGKLDLLCDNVPNNAAAALFSTKLSGYTQMRLRMARFRGINKMEFIDNQRVEGNFFQLLDAGMAFFLKHLNMSGKIVGFRREESMEVPAEALREALTNSLCHRQFEKYNLTPSIAIYDDRIEIENPGVLPPQLNTETIRQSHGSYPYNPVMAEVLYRTTFLESWGSGASRIIDACKAHNVAEPTWSINGGFVCVTFARPITDPMKAPVGLQLEAGQAHTESGQGADTSKFGPNDEPSTNQARTKHEPSTNQVCTKLVPSSYQARTKYVPSSYQVKELINIMTEKYCSLVEIIGQFSVKNKTRFRREYILPALADGAIERKYPDNPKHPRQQYRLTGQAIEWKNSQKKQ